MQPAETAVKKDVLFQIKILTSFNHKFCFLSHDHFTNEAMCLFAKILHKTSKQCVLLYLDLIYFHKTYLYGQRLLVPKKVHTTTFVDFFGPSLSRPFQRFAWERCLRTMGKVDTIIPQNDPIHLAVIIIQTITKANCMSSLKVLDPIV